MEQYKSFVFLASWEELLQGFPPDVAKEILWQIKEVGVGKDFSTNDPMIKAIIKGSVLPNILNQQEKYETAKRGGRPRNEDITIDKIKALEDCGLTQEQIADTLKCSLSTIKNRIRESETETDK